MLSRVHLHAVLGFTQHCSILRNGTSAFSHKSWQSISQHSSQQHYKVLSNRLCAVVYKPSVASWIEPTCPIGSHPGAYNSVLLYFNNLTCPLGSHPVLHLCDYLSVISLYKGFKYARSPQWLSTQCVIYLRIRLGVTGLGYWLVNVPL